MYGISNSGKAVYGASSAGQGVYAQSSTGRAFEGHTNGGIGAYVTNTSGNGGDFGGSYAGLIGRSNTFPLVITNASGGNLFYIDGNGNVYYHGSLSHFASPGGSPIVTSYAQSTTPSIEETGTARLAFGQANVAFSASFARSINASRVYQVFLTPGGDTRGLYVATKYTGGFTVKEMQGGRSNIPFDYHVYAVTGPSSAAQSAPSFGEPRVMPVQPAAVPAITAPRTPAVQRPPE
jgi:hypothetical protein